MARFIAQWMARLHRLHSVKPSSHGQVPAPDLLEMVETGRMDALRQHAPTAPLAQQQQALRAAAHLGCLASLDILLEALPAKHQSAVPEVLRHACLMGETGSVRRLLEALPAPARPAQTARCLEDLLATPRLPPSVDAVLALLVQHAPVDRVQALGRVLLEVQNPRLVLLFDYLPAAFCYQVLETMPELGHHPARLRALAVRAALDLDAATQHLDKPTPHKRL